MPRKVFIFIATSLDGFIAREDGNIDWLSIADTAGEDYGYSEINKDTDTIIMGRKTYDKLREFADEFPVKNKTVYIISHSERQGEKNIVFSTKGPGDLIRELKSQVGKSVYVDGRSSGYTGINEAGPH